MSSSFNAKRCRSICQKVWWWIWRAKVIFIWLLRLLPRLSFVAIKVITKKLRREIETNSHVDSFKLRSNLLSTIVPRCKQKPVRNTRKNAMKNYIRNDFISTSHETKFAAKIPIRRKGVNVKCARGTAIQAIVIPNYALLFHFRSPFWLFLLHHFYHWMK